MPHLPVGEHRLGRAGNGQFTGSGETVIYEGQAHPDPPPPPKWLDRRGRRIYRSLWALPESQLWHRQHGPAVARLARLTAELEGGRSASWLFVQLSALEDRLLLSPKSPAHGARPYQVRP